MPRARRLSNSSQEAFEEFCEKHKPLSRRLSQGGGEMSSNRSLAGMKDAPLNDGKAAGGAKRALLARRMSNSSLLGRQQPSRNAVSKQKGVEVTSPSKKKTDPDCKARGGNKENGNGNDSDMNVLQSPTPYWKVAKERGRHSPRETRASKRRKTARKKSNGRTLNFDGADGIELSPEKARDGLMLFSPPDQVANAKREKMVLDEKMKAREKRIQQNKENGQLLVFSTRFENLTPLPTDGDDAHVRAARKTAADETYQMPDADSLEKSGQPAVEGTGIESAPSADASFSSVSMDEETRVQRPRGADSSIQDSINEKRTEEMLNVIKGLGKQFENLDRRLSEMHKPASSVPLPPKPSNEDKMNLEAKIIQIQTLSELCSKHETKHETLIKELQMVESKFSSEREQFMVEKERLQMDFEQAKASTITLEATLKECMEKNEMLENKLLPQSEERLRAALEEIKLYKDRLDEAMLKLQGQEELIRDLKRENERLCTEKEEEKKHFQVLNEESYRVHAGMEEQILDRTNAIEELQHSLASVTAELDQTRLRTSEKIREVEDALSQLNRVSKERDDVQKQLSEAMDRITKDSEFMNDVVAKNKGTSAALRALDEQKQYLEKRLKDTEKELKGVKDERDNAIFRLGSSDQREEDLFSRLRESERVRRELHARVMVLIGSIRVFVRVRPVIPEELDTSSNGGKTEEIFHFTNMGGSQGAKKSKYGSDDPTKNILEVVEPTKDRGGLSQRNKKWKFGFDQVFDPSHGQEDVWEASEPLVQSAIDGFNVTIFAYGQTGSGKTHTMLGVVGSPNEEGLVSRSIRKLFDAKNEIEELSRGEKKVVLTVELLEIYNEQVRDLLVEKGGGNASGDKHSLKVVANEAVGSIRQVVTNESEVFKVLHKAQQRRCVKATSSNATSSRSHLLFTIQFIVKSNDGSIQSGKLNICDLAGSERLGKSGANVVGGALLQETKHINLSLSTLSNVIEKLQAGDSNVPYRDSKLTSLLQNSLGGNSKTLCIVCCNPLQTHFHETLCSLRFAAKINKVDLKAVANFSA